MANLRARIAILTTIPVILVILIYFHLDTISKQGEPLIDDLSDRIARLTSGDKIEHHALYLAQGMQSWMKYPLDISDFAKKGDRVNAVSGLMKIVQDHPTKKLKTDLTKILDHEYPWWNRAADEYHPWDQPWLLNPQRLGIVICAGSNNLIFATEQIRILRHALNSTLPIDIAHAGDTDLRVEHQTFLKSLGSNIRTLDVLKHFNESTVGLKDGGYAIKPFAALASRFQQVILLDADTVFLQHPDTLLARYPTFNSTGLLFYHDRAYRTDNTRKDWISSKLHFRNLSTTLTASLFWREDLWQEMESGVVGIDKSRPNAFMTLLFAAWMNTKPVRDAETYQHVLGDKETYWLAAEFARLPYTFVPGYAGIIGSAERGRADKICSTHLAHMDESGEVPLWFNGGVAANKFLPGEKGRDLGEFSAYITAGSEMDQMPKWVSMGEVWCAEGRAVRKLNGGSSSSNASTSNGSSSSSSSSSSPGERSIVGGTLSRILEESREAIRVLEMKGLL